jgi:hypothetical protein
MCGANSCDYLTELQRHPNGSQHPGKIWDKVAVGAATQGRRI